MEDQSNDEEKGYQSIKNKSPFDNASPMKWKVLEKMGTPYEAPRPAREDENIEAIWQMTSKLVKDISSLSGSIMKEFDKKVNLLQYQKILLMFVQRIHINYVAIENLMPSYRNFHSLNFSILTLLRPLLADFLLELFLLKKSISEKGINENEFLNQFNGLTVSALEKMNQSLSNENPNIESRSRIIEAIRNLKSVEKIELTPKGMLDEIRRSAFNDYQGAYHVYSVLSQFEHFTNVSEKFMEPNLNSTYELINVSSEYICNGMLFSLHLCPINIDLIERTAIVLKSVSASRTTDPTEPIDSPHLSTMI